MKLEVSDMYRVASNRWARAYIKELYAMAAAFIAGFALVVAGVGIADVGEAGTSMVWTHGCTVLVTLGGVVLTGMLVCIIVYVEKAINYKREFVQKWVDEEKGVAIEAVTTRQLQELVTKTLALSLPDKKAKRQVSKK